MSAWHTFDNFVEVPPPPPPIPDGQMRADIWHWTVYCDSQVVFDFPNMYCLSPPDNGYVWPPDWLAGGRVPLALASSGHNTSFPGDPISYISGPNFYGANVWLPWIRNAYWDGALLNSLQGGTGVSTAYSPFVDSHGSWTITPYLGAGGGRAARGSVSQTDGRLWLNDVSTYHRGSVGVTYTAQWDISTYQIGQGNAAPVGMTIEFVARRWTPWAGYSTFPPNQFSAQNITLPLIDGTGGSAEGSPHSWDFQGGFIERTRTTGPGYSITMSNADSTWHTMKLDATHLSHEYPGLHYDPSTFSFEVVW